MAISGIGCCKESNSVDELINPYKYLSGAVHSIDSDLFVQLVVWYNSVVDWVWVVQFPTGGIVDKTVQSA